MSQAEPTTTSMPWKPAGVADARLADRPGGGSPTSTGPTSSVSMRTTTSASTRKRTPGDFPELKANVYASFEQYIQGRPLMFAFGHTLAFLSTQPGGSFATAYIVACGVQVFNAWLVFSSRARAIGPRFAPVRRRGVRPRPGRYDATLPARLRFLSSQPSH